MPKSRCLFCQIAQKEVPAKIEYEDKEVLVFWDINPKAPVHLLIIPKKHIQSAATLSERETQIAGKLILVAKEMAKKMKIDKTGYRLIFNVGANSGQVIEHIHLHLIGGRILGPLG